MLICSVEIGSIYDRGPVYGLSLFTGVVLAVASNDSTVKMYELANGQVGDAQ